MATTRTITVVVTINEGYEALASETVKAPVTIDLTVLQDIVARKLGAITEQVAGIYGDPYRTSVETVLTPAT